MLTCLMGLWIMVIALGFKHVVRPRSASAICNHKFDFRPKLHERKCCFLFIIFILKSSNGHIGLLTKKNTPERVQFCNIATRKQNGRLFESFALGRLKQFNEKISNGNKGKGPRSKFRHIIFFFSSIEHFLGAINVFIH